LPSWGFATFSRVRARGGNDDVRKFAGKIRMLFDLSHTLRSLTASPITTAVNEARRMARRRLEAGGAATASPPTGSRRQRDTQHTSATATRIARRWRPGERVTWRGRAAAFRRNVGDGVHAEIAVGGRVYRVRLAELA
jgi:hypothetical protein